MFMTKQTSDDLRCYSKGFEDGQVHAMGKLRKATLRELRTYVDRMEARRAWATLPAKCQHGRRTACVKCWPPTAIVVALATIDRATKPAKGAR